METTVAPDAELVRAVPLFAGLPDSAIAAIADLARPADFPTGAVLVRQGDLGDTLLIIVHGRANVDQDGTVIRELGAGDFLGEISLIDGGPRTATVTAIEPIDALTIDREGFDQLMNRHPAVRLGLVMALSERLRQQAPSISN